MNERVTHPQLEEHPGLGQQSGPLWVLLQAPVLVPHWIPSVPQQRPRQELLCYRQRSEETESEND